jgi:heme oxygenase (mycobilin-producing)
MMYIVANRVPVAAQWREQFEERFRTRAGQIDTQPGFVSMQVLRPADAESPYVVLTTWHDKAAFEAWVGSEDFRLAHQHPLPKEAYTGEGRLERHEVVIAATARVTP